METTVAIGVIITAIVGSISLVSFTIRSTNSTLNRLVAQNLAWEAIEVSVNLRDTNFLTASTAYDASLNAAPDTTSIFTFDDATNVWLVDSTPNSFNDAATTMYLVNGLYKQASAAPGGAATQFKRLIDISEPTPGQLEVAVTVQWNERGSIFDVVAHRSLYDWKNSS